MISISLHKINSKQIKNLNVKPETLNLPERNRDNTINYKEAGQELLNKFPRAQELRPTFDKWNFIQLKSICTAKRVISVKKKLREWEKISITCVSKGIKSEQTKNLNNRVRKKSFQIMGLRFEQRVLKIRKKIIKKYLRNVHHP